MWGDFGRYVVEPATRDFRAPNEKRRLAAARKAAAHRFEQRWAELLASLGDGAEEFVNAVGILDDPLASLSEGQRTLWDAAMREYGDTKCIRGPLPFDQELACRWVFSRTLSLGWTPGKFGAFDRLIDRDASRTGHKVERIGKKYEWIALHELLARIADHCALTPRWSDAPHKPYDGPWQLSIRDIDPSLPGAVKAWRRASDRACWWSPIAMTIPDGADSREAQAWVEDPAKLPDAPSLLCVDDLQGVRWLTLQGYYHWRGETPPELHHLEAESCWLWYQVRGYLLQASDVERFVDWAKGQNWMGRWMPESITVHEAFLGEYPWHPSWAQATSGWSTPGDRNGPVPLLVPVVEYSSEGNGYDCSVDETVNAMLPAPNLISGMGLRWSGSDLTYERAGRPVIQDPSGRGDGPGVLLAARDPLSEFLAKEGLALAWTILGEKLRSIKGPSRFTRRQIHGAAVFDAGTLRQISVSSEYLDR